MTLPQFGLRAMLILMYASKPENDGVGVSGGELSHLFNSMAYSVLRSLQDHGFMEKKGKMYFPTEKGYLAVSQIEKAIELVQ